MAHRRIVVLTRDRTGPRMGGNAVRATELARVLATHGDVTLGAPGTPPEPDAPFRHVPWEVRDPAGLRTLLRSTDVVVAAPQSPVVQAELRRCGARLVVDLYDPFPLAVLEGRREAHRLRRRLDTTLTLDTFVAALGDAHHALCASERQRDLWLGLLLGIGLLKPSTYDSDPSLRERLDVVPIGIPTTPPPPPAGRLRSRVPQLADGDEVVLWYGGLWSWMDPETAVRAVAELLPRRPRARLVVLGRAPAAGERRSADAARRAAGELGVAGREVAFVDELVPYAERGGWLREAHCAVSTHLDHLETRFAFRTRVLDFIWAGLPSVCTEGDDLSALVASRGLGATVPPADVPAVAAALDAVLAAGRGAAASRFEAVVAELAWPRVAAPLVRFATAVTLPPRLGACAPPARPGVAARALAIRGLRAGQRALGA